VACNNNNAGKANDIKDTVPQIIQMPQTPAVPHTGFTGVGTEPCWPVYVINNSKIFFHPADGPDVETSLVTSIPDRIPAKYSSVNGSTTMELIITKKNAAMDE
jgi:uncharacterized membrane protein